MPLTERPCSKCGNSFDRDELTVKRIAFYKFGKNGKMIKSRTVGWLCPGCLQSDGHWSAEPYEQQKAMQGEPA